MFSNSLIKVIGILSIFLIAFACNTIENVSETKAIVKTFRIYPSFEPLVTDSEYTIVKRLFSKNNLSLSNLKVYRLREQTGYHVRCYQYYDSLEVFSNDVVFSFNLNEIFTFLGGKLIDNINIDFLPKIPMEDASNLFYKEISTDEYQKDSLVAYINYGFNAELGIYDLNAGKSYDQENFVLAWRLTINNNSKYPYAYFRADVLELIYYSNGVIIN